MAKAKQGQGATVSVVAKVPVNYNGTLYSVGDTIDVEEAHLQQLTDVSAVEVPAAPEEESPAQ